MKTWFLSLHGAITLAVISLLVFLGRTFIDFYYVYGEFNLSISIVSGAVLIKNGESIRMFNWCRSGFVKKRGI